MDFDERASRDRESLSPQDSFAPTEDVEEYQYVTSDEDEEMVSSQEFIPMDLDDVEDREDLKRVRGPPRMRRMRGNARASSLPKRRTRITVAPMIEEEELKRKHTSRALVENPTIDLESYISNYSGNAKIDRLVFISEHSPPLTIEALKMAVDLVKQTQNLPRYVALLKILNDHLNSKGQPTIPVDTVWVEDVKRNVAQEQDRLETDLKNYKNNMIKESIRVAYNELATFYYRCGDLTNAIKHFIKTRDYAVTQRQVLDMCMDVVPVAWEANNINAALSHLNKAETNPELAPGATALEPEQKKLLMAKIKATHGLLNLTSGNYKKAAKHFLQTSFDLKSNYNEVLSPNDVATYGVLCSLASMDRMEVRTQVLENAEYKQFLELEPAVREALYAFYQGKYSQVLEGLNKVKNDLLLDIHLSSHVEPLFQDIRKRILAQYFAPFDSLDLEFMAKNLNTSVESLETELIPLIQDGTINAKIDSHRKALYVKQEDKRLTLLNQTFAQVVVQEKQARQLLRRIQLFNNDFVVK